MPKTYPWFSRIILLLVTSLAFTACEKEPRLIPDNNAPDGDYVPTVLIENYVNRMYIDLLGREALDSEMIRDVQLLRDDSLGVESRTQIIYRLQHDNTSVPGDSSYKHAD
jgi:hypothetical protein